MENDKQRFLLQPLRFGAEVSTQSEPVFNGLALTRDADRHLRDKVLAVLFTAPGERVNNPRFGVGLNRVVFEGLDELTIAALEFRVSQGLRRDIGSEILIDGIDIETRGSEGTLFLNIRYRRRADRVPQNLEIEL